VLAAKGDIWKTMLSWKWFRIYQKLSVVSPLSIAYIQAQLFGEIISEAFGRT
jgi:hypothetical protein